MKQTAVAFMVEQLNQSIGLTKFVDVCDEAYKNEILTIIKTAKEMFEQQIKDAFEKGFITTQWDKTKENKAEQYYNETFKQQENGNKMG
jgi:hypothetical protein